LRVSPDRVSSRCCRRTEKREASPGAAATNGYRTCTIGSSAEPGPLQPTFAPSEDRKRFWSPNGRKIALLRKSAADTKCLRCRRSVAESAVSCLDCSSRLMRRVDFRPCLSLGQAEDLDPSRARPLRQKAVLRSPLVLDLQSVILVVGELARGTARPHF
jgi:hypothetical protein